MEIGDLYILSITYPSVMNLALRRGAKNKAEVSLSRCPEVVLCSQTFYQMLRRKRVWSTNPIKDLPQSSNELAPRTYSIT